MLDEDKEVEKKEKPVEQQNQIEIVDPCEASKEMLLKCNIIKNKKPHAYSLRKGDGHIMVMSDLNMGQIYEKVLHNPLRASI